MLELHQQYLLKRITHKLIHKKLYLNEKVGIEKSALS